MEEVVGSATTEVALVGLGDMLCAASLSGDVALRLVEGFKISGLTKSPFELSIQQAFKNIADGQQSYP